MNAYTIILSLKLMLNALNYIIPFAGITLAVSIFAIIKELCKKSNTFKLCK